MQIDLCEVLSLVDIYIQTFAFFIEMLSVSTDQHNVSCAKPLWNERDGLALLGESLRQCVGHCYRVHHIYIVIEFPLRFIKKNMNVCKILEIGSRNKDWQFLALNISNEYRKSEIEISPRWVPRNLNVQADFFKSNL